MSQNDMLDSTCPTADQLIEMRIALNTALTRSNVLEMELAKLRQVRKDLESQIKYLANAVLMLQLRNKELGD